MRPSPHRQIHGRMPETALKYISRVCYNLFRENKL